MEQGAYMTAKIEFMKMYHKMPGKARRELVYDFATNPMSLNVCYLEIRNNTKLGKVILNELGYKG